MWGGVVFIQSPSSDRAGVLDDASALRWQADKIADIRSRNRTLEVSSEHLRSKSMTFYCLDVRTGFAGDSILCKAGRTDWLVFIATENVGAVKAQIQLQEARTILKSME